MNIRLAGCVAFCALVTTAAASPMESGTAAGNEVADRAEMPDSRRLPLVTLDGLVTDGSGAQWPVYSQILITPTQGRVRRVYNHLARGHSPN